MLDFSRIKEVYTKQQIQYYFLVVQAPICKDHHHTLYLNSQQLVSLREVNQIQIRKVEFNQINLAQGSIQSQESQPNSLST